MTALASGCGACRPALRLGAARSEPLRWATRDSLACHGPCGSLSDSFSLNALRSSAADSIRRSIHPARRNPLHAGT